MTQEQREDKKMIKQDILNKFLRSGYESIETWIEDNCEFIDEFNDRKLADLVCKELVES